MKEIFKYLEQYKRKYTRTTFKLLEACFELVIPLVVAQIIDVGIRNRDISYVVKMIGIMALLYLIGLACSITAQYFAAKAATAYGTQVRHKLLNTYKFILYRDGYHRFIHLNN